MLLVVIVHVYVYGIADSDTGRKASGPFIPLGFSQGDEWPARLAPSVAICYTVDVDMDYHHEQHSVHLLVYHIIWCPKRRRKVLVGPVRTRLE